MRTSRERGGASRPSRDSGAGSKPASRLEGHAERPPTRISCIVVIAAILAIALLAAATPAGASEQFGDLDVAFLSLKVNADGEALVAYRTSDGVVRHVYVWGAINAIPPNPGKPQVRFIYDYSGGLKKNGRKTWTTFRDTCRAYDGPPLVWLVAACKAPDGSYWALQRWQRLLPMRGVDPFRPDQASFELHISHWSGPLPVLEVSQNWTYGGAWQGLFGRLTYNGSPVFGFRTPSSRRRDPYARFFYVDTFNSMFGPGWKHDAGKVAHSRNGAFCYSFVPQYTPVGYPLHVLRPAGNGERHRVTVMGPGVTPVIQWEGSALGSYDPQQDALFNTLFDRIVGADDRVCVRER